MAWIPNRMLLTCKRHSSRTESRGSGGVAGLLRICHAMHVDDCRCTPRDEQLDVARFAVHLYDRGGLHRGLWCVQHHRTFTPLTGAFCCQLCYAGFNISVTRPGSTSPALPITTSSKKARFEGSSGP